MCTVKKRPQWCRITPCEKCPFYNARKMTQEEKQLLLKGICSRLPYGVECKLSDDLYGTICGIDIMPHGTFVKTYINRDTFEDKAIEDIKLYLRSMSSMTEKERKDYKETCFSGIIHTLATFEWFHAHHFDYRGLIEKGLALEAPEGMYKTE